MEKPGARGCRGMKLIRFSLPRELPAWEALINEIEVDVQHTYLVTEDGRTSVYLEYEFIPELTQMEEDRLQILHGLADRLCEDKVLPALKNSTQRELYLLEVYNVDSHTAGRVWEYMKMQEKMKEVQ